MDQQVCLDCYRRNKPASLSATVRARLATWLSSATLTGFGFKRFLIRNEDDFDSIALNCSSNTLSTVCELESRTHLFPFSKLFSGNSLSRIGRMCRSVHRCAAACILIGFIHLEIEFTGSKISKIIIRQIRFPRVTEEFSLSVLVLRYGELSLVQNKHFRVR